MRLWFDRGTLVLRDPPASLDVPQLPGLLWDPRVEGWRAPALCYAALAARLSELGVRWSDEVRNPDEAPDGAASPHAAWISPPELRPYQDEALCAWELSGRRGVIVLPTGSGKTRVALAAIARLAVPTLCLVPTRVLLAQWLEAIGGVYAGEVGVLGDGQRSVARLTVATFESAWRHGERLGDRFGLLVVDEAHHFGAGLRDEALEMMVAPARLGLTATPPRDPAIRARLDELVGPLVFERTIGDLAGTWLADFDLVTVHVDLARAERERYEAWMAAFRPVRARFQEACPGGSWQEFASAAARSEEGRRAMTAFRLARELLLWTEGKRAALARLMERHRASRLIVFTADNKAAYAIAREHLIMPLTCDVGAAERAEALARFADGRLRALVSARVLNEGIDVPDAEVAVVVAGALGEREHVQRVGRLLRPRAGKRALVYELVTRASHERRQAERRRQGLVPRKAAGL